MPDRPYVLDGVASNDAWVGAALHPSIATDSAPAFIVGNGMRSTPTVTYFIDVRGDGPSQFATYRLRIGQLV